MWSHNKSISWRGKVFFNFIDDFFKETFFYTMITKFGVLDKLKVFKAMVAKKPIGKKIKAIKCNGGGEYQEFQCILQK
jgi:hypothetical protein